MMETCKVLYDDGKWYEGTITGCEMIEGIWQYKITFSDGKSTYASIDDPEVKYHHHIKQPLTSSIHVCTL